MPAHSSTEPRFFFLMPVWGEQYVDFLLTFGLPTLLAENNFPCLPNRDHSQFIFLTTAEDEKRIRSSRLFGILESLLPVKFMLFDLHKGSRTDKFHQLGTVLKAGAEQALGNGFCFFLHPDGLYSDGMLKFLYGIAQSGKKACVSHGPVVTQETIVPYLQEKGLYRFDAVNPLPPRVLARTLMDNLHPDMTTHCMGNPYYPQDPYMGFWRAPTGDGALFRFVSLHPWMVDLRELTEITDFNAIDHNFIRAHKFIWSEIHVETDSDNFLALGIKPRAEMNAVPSKKENLAPAKSLMNSLLKWSNCNYSRFCFFNGIKVHQGDLNRAWREFESTNLSELNSTLGIKVIILTFALSGLQFSLSLPSIREPFRLLRRVYFYARRFFYHSIVRANPLFALRKVYNVITRNRKQSIRHQRLFGKRPIRRCWVCRPGEERCLSNPDSIKA